MQQAMRTAEQAIRDQHPDRRPVSFAVIIPLHNQRDYLARAVRSVLAQTHPPAEIVIVDDGSTDGGARGLPELQHTAIRILEQTRAGASAARNAGVRQTTAPWVAFLDADDEWFPTYLQQCAYTIQRYPEVAAVFANVLELPRGRPWLHGMTGEPRLLNDYFAFAIANNGRGMLTSAVVVSRTVLEGIGGFPESIQIGEDLDTWQRIAWTGPVAFIPECLSIYHRNTPGSATKLRVSLRVASLQKTYDAWSAAGRIPQHLLGHSQELIWLQNRWIVGHLLRWGQYRKAREVLLTECRPTPYTRQFIALWARTMLPGSVQDFGKRVRSVRKRKC